MHSFILVASVHMKQGKQKNAYAPAHRTQTDRLTDTYANREKQW